MEENAAAPSMAVRFVGLPAVKEMAGDSYEGKGTWLANQERRAGADGGAWCHWVRRWSLAVPAVPADAGSLPVHGASVGASASDPPGTKPSSKPFAMLPPANRLSAPPCCEDQRPTLVPSSRLPPSLGPSTRGPTTSHVLRQTCRRPLHRDLELGTARARHHATVHSISMDFLGDPSGVAREQVRQYIRSRV